MSNQSHTGQEAIADDQTESDDPVPTGREPDDSSRRPCAAPPEIWESVGRTALATLLEAALDDLSRETRLAADRIRRGESVTEDDFLRVRDGVEGLELVVEDLMTDLSTEVEPYERTVGRIPAGRLRAALADTDATNPGIEGDAGPSQVH